MTRSVLGDNARTVLYHLECLGKAVKAMNHVFYKNIRAKLIDPAGWNECIKPIYGWGVNTEEPLEGASGLQLGSIQCADAVLGIGHETFLPKAAVESRRYRPESHRRFLSVMDEVRALVPRYVRERDDPLLTQCYNACVDALRSWRHAHQRRGALYLHGNGNGPMGGYNRHGNRQQRQRGRGFSFDDAGTDRRDDESAYLDSTTGGYPATSFQRMLGIE